VLLRTFTELMVTVMSGLLLARQDVCIAGCLTTALQCENNHGEVARTVHGYIVCYSSIIVKETFGRKVLQPRFEPVLSGYIPYMSLHYSAQILR
jgi:hypothetical protein